MKTDILASIESPADLAPLSLAELESLAAEIREFLTATVGKTGGHLASNLGIVEITLALHRAYDFSHDRLVFDVGHQCYVHKIITGRRDRFATLRQLGGITGFPNPEESVYDPFVVGHASTAISSAVGLAAGFRLAGDDRKVVAVVGDGAIGGGMCFEAMNHAGQTKEDLLVILNDNDMAIAETVGAFSEYLTGLRCNPGARKIREDIARIFDSVPLIGHSLSGLQERLLEIIKGQAEPTHIFSAMGFQYFGPVDGHDLSGLETEIGALRNIRGPKILHAVTSKGRGFAAASADPETFHSAVPFEIRAAGEAVTLGEKKNSYTDCFVEQLKRIAREDDQVVAITAAMPAGTGIKEFAAEFPGRFIDVGICEAHSVTFAAGLARTGIKPVLAIYSTFMQRGYDQIIHDVAVQKNLNVTFALDRAGLVGADGPTHHGVFDIAFLRHIPGLILLAPRDGQELGLMLEFALGNPGVKAIRYPRGAPPENIFPADYAEVLLGKSELLRKGKDGAVFAYGRMVENAYRAAELASLQGVDLRVINARFAKPLDAQAIANAARETGLIFTVEDHALPGGFGSAVAEYLADQNLACRLRRIGIPDRFIEHGSCAQLDEMLGLSPETLCETFLANVNL
jgi:1-deoxy-D-xylulose-5-phosphate synthase